MRSLRPNSLRGMGVTERSKQVYAKKEAGQWGGVGRSESWETRPGVRWNKAFFGRGGQGGARRFVVGRIREPTSLLVKRHRLNHWTTREVPGIKHS